MSHANPSELARRLSAISARGDAAAPYRLARLVARVLVSTNLRQRRKWCSLATALMQDPAVEHRLVRQAIGWLTRGRDLQPVES